MSFKKSETQQKKLERIKKGIDSDFRNENISDVILLDFPAWSICYKDGSHTDSYEYSAAIRRSIYKFLKEKD